MPILRLGKNNRFTLWRHECAWLRIDFQVDKTQRLVGGLLTSLAGTPMLRLYSLSLSKEVMRLLQVLALKIILILNYASTLLPFPVS